MNKFISKVIGEKRQWRQHKARTRELPASYRMRSRPWSGT